MDGRRNILIVVLSAVVCLTAQAQKWSTYFAYNNVEQIALGDACVYALSDGSLFSVDKQSEQLKMYNNRSGLHGTGITAIHYDQPSRSLIIGYQNGKIDLMKEKDVRYVGDLYDKDMTQRKTIYNITIHNRMAYLSTHYGVQTLNLRELKLVDSYWLLPNGLEKPISDVKIEGDTIYAFGEDSLFCAGLHDNLVDYRVWKREAGRRVSPDGEKGKHYTDGPDQWYAGYMEGVVRYTPTGRLTYKPEGPLTNIPYSLTATRGHLWMVAGGRWSAQNNTSGDVMHYHDGHWTNITSDALRAFTQSAVEDMMNVAVDPHDVNHYFVTSYGTGLYEFRENRCINHWIADGTNSLVSIIADNPAGYTRLDNAVYDKDGNLWMTDAMTDSQLQCLDAQGGWHALTVYGENEPYAMHTPGGLIIDNQHPNYKWLFTARYNTSVCLLDDGGTRWDGSDDRTCIRSNWTDQHGRPFAPGFIYATAQDAAGRVWLGTDVGVAYIEQETDFFNSDAVIRPDFIDSNGENPLTTLRVDALCPHPDGTMWVGTQTLGVYVLDHTLTEIVAHYTTDNSTLPANGILSIACDESGVVYIGSSEGLVAYNPNGIDEGLSGVRTETDDSGTMDEGSMLRWRLHLSYSDATELAATPRYIYAVANGSLFSYDRADGMLDYRSRLTGLSGNAIAHIAYDNRSGNLIVAYDDGRIDLIDEKGGVRQMPDIYMKAGSVDVTINSICVGARNTYLAMPFGIVVIDPGKGEVRDTYYIGSEAAAVDVKSIVESGDTLYAFTANAMYSAALADNMVDYHFWHMSALPLQQLQQAAMYEGALYTLQHDSLYRLSSDGWEQVVPQAVNWMHLSGGQLLLCAENKNLYRMTDDGTLRGLCDRYYIHDAVYSQGEYWLGEYGLGLIHLGSEGDEYYHTDGPNSNFGYQMCAAHGNIYAVSGGRWAAEFGRPARLNRFDGTRWYPVNESHFVDRLGKYPLDAVSVAVDPNDAGHFFIATYGTGLYEFRNYEAVRLYMQNNSTLRPYSTTVNADYYTRTDGAMIDEQGNLWVLNSTTLGQPVHVLTPNGQWHALPLRSYGTEIQFTTPAGIWTDQRKSQYKWMFDQRYSPCAVLLDDGGTPALSGDDKCIARSSFIDQNGNTITPTAFRCFAQDMDDNIWIGTDKGIVLIDAKTDFFSSNACRRIIIPRNDGTGLGDYLLGDEQINCMAVDGGNRMWIGTANSGLYLIEDDTITVAHFTETNSLLPSNSVQSIAIMPTTGEVFVGTDRGIASYRSDASAPMEDMKQAYAFPNPVRANYSGMITIAGLMENTTVNIIDEGGSLICKTRSHGGMAVWDGKAVDGKRAKGGVYTALCNAPDGVRTVKILVIR